MKLKSLIIIGLLCLAFVTGLIVLPDAHATYPPAVPPNLLPNDSFEYWESPPATPVPWAVNGHCDQITLYVHNGTYSVGLDGYGQTFHQSGGMPDIYVAYSFGDPEDANISLSDIGEASVWFFTIDRSEEDNSAIFLELGYRDYSGGSYTNYYEDYCHNITNAEAGNWAKFDFTDQINRSHQNVMLFGFTVWGATVAFDDAYLGAYPIQPSYISVADAENIDADPIDWVFTDWKYYNFKINNPNINLGAGNLSETEMRFNVTNGQVEIQCTFSVNNTDREHTYLDYADDSWSWSLETSLTPEEETRFGQPLLITSGIVSYDSANNETDITILIFFNKQCLDAYDSNLAISTELQTTWGNQTLSWYDGNYTFYIYSKGGFQKDFLTSNWATANHYQGEEWCAFFADYGYWVEDTIWFRDLQHVKMLPMIEGYTGLDPFSMTFAVDYSVGEGEWLPGWECVISPVTVHYSGLFAQEVWINMTVTWYQGHGTPGSYTFVKTDDLYMFFHGTVTGQYDPFNFRFWFDAWFNSINASSTGGGRVNAFEYPMKDDADLWFRWLANNWGVKDDVEKESMYMGDLLDTNGQIMNSERIKMVRLKVRLDVYNASGGQVIYLHNYEVLDYTHSKELPLHGIQTPVFDDTKMPDVGQTGLLGALFSVFQGIGQWLGENVMFGGLNLWGNFVAFLDTIAGWLGAPKFFTNLFNWIGSGFTYLTQSATYVFTLLYNFFLMIGQLMGAFITTLGEFVLSIITTLGYLVDFLGGIGTGAGNLWVQFNIWGWVQVALVFYPLYLIILWDQEGMDAVLSQFTLIWGIAAWLFGFFIQIIMAVISFAHTLIESIPVAE